MNEQQPIEPSYSAFESLVGNEFTAQFGDQQIRFKLITVSQLPPATSRTDLNIRQDPFSLQFEEVTDFGPEQGMFTLRGEGGVIELFLVPAGFGEYLAIFN